MSQNLPDEGQPVSDEPQRPAAKRTDTATPFATLPPRPDTRKSTGPRVKIENSAAPESSPFDHPLPVSDVDPAALQKPFASLTPRRPEPSTAPSADVEIPAAAPPPPSQLFAETSGQSVEVPRTGTASDGSRSTSPRTTTAPRATTSRRPESTQAGKYGMCKEHGTALTREGNCVLCIRAEAKRKSERGWRIIVALAALAVLIGAAVAWSVTK